jgi:hypothetical protein
MPVVASQCQSLPASTDHSHSIVNKPFFQFNINGLVVGAGSNTMKNTMLRKSFKMLEKFADCATVRVEDSPLLLSKLNIPQAETHP